MLSIFVLITSLLSFSFAKTYNVDVGRVGLTFTPNILYNIEINDVVNFHFYPANHSVAESTFDRPCKPKSGGVDDKPIYSGFVPTTNGVASQMWSMTINTSDPIWLYCSQGDHQHCRNGQSMVINPLNNTDETLEAYMQAAQKANVSSPDMVFGGELVDDDGEEADQGAQAMPGTSMGMSTTKSTSTTSIATPTTTSKSGVAPVMANLVWELGIWGFLAAVFLITW